MWPNNEFSSISLNFNFLSSDPLKRNWKASLLKFGFIFNVFNRFGLIEFVLDSFRSCLFLIYCSTENLTPRTLTLNFTGKICCNFSYKNLH